MQTLTPQSRAAILENPEALECTLYRPDEYDEEAEEQDLGDARIIISGPFKAPAEWDAKDRDDYFDGTAPEAFVVARIACQAAPDSGVYFTAVPGDYAAVTESPGQVSMFYVWDCLNDAEGQYVLIREEEDDEV